MVLRDATVDDVDALAKLTDGHTLFARYGLSSGGLGRELAASLRHGSEGIRMAVDGGRPLGFAWWASRGAFARSPYLRLLVVAAAATGQGVGGALLDDLEARAFASAADLFLLVTADNLAAQRFYARRGYVEVGRLPDYVTPGITEVVMRKRSNHRLTLSGHAAGTTP